MMTRTEIKKKNKKQNEWTRKWQNTSLDTNIRVTTSNNVLLFEIVLEKWIQFQCNKQAHAMADKAVQYKFRLNTPNSRRSTCIRSKKTVHARTIRFCQLYELECFVYGNKPQKKLGATSVIIMAAGPCNA